MRVSFYCVIAFLTVGLNLKSVHAQQQPKLAAQMATTVMTDWDDRSNPSPSVFRPNKWSYDLGVIYEGLEGLWKRTGDARYFKSIQKNMDSYLDKDGNIINYKPSDFNIDHLKNGRTLLMLFKVTGQQKYFKTATVLWEQLKQQPRTKEGGFWHKKIYPNQMWLDGLYMGEPFYAEYATLIKDEKAFDDIANQFIWMEKNSRDSKTGLMYHGWDESKTEQWADKVTGRSPNFWARAMGWYGMGLVDVLDYFPANHPKRKDLLAILDRFAVAVSAVQDSKSGLWYDILDLPKAEGNYVEASASNMFVYTFAKAVRNGYLPKKYFSVAERGYEGVKTTFVERVDNQRINLKGTVSVSGLGGKPYRDGSFAYYMSEKVVVNDPKGVGAFLLAANEMETADLPKPGSGKLVTLDSYFNNEIKTDQSGNTVSWHYKWDELPNPGFSMLGGIFNRAGFSINTLYDAPTLSNLKKSSVYIIVDPDFEKENPNPMFVEKNHIDALTKWVKKGGVLVLMANDAPNAELKHFNELAGQFGVYFNGDSKGTVPVATNFETAKVEVNGENEIFKKSKNLFIKEYSSLKLSGNARSILKDKDGDNVMSVTKLGKGTVYIIGDPWLYNEYVDGRKLPTTYQNFEAAEELVNWLAQKASGKK